MATRLIGTDDANPVLPQVVIDATQFAGATSGMVPPEPTASATLFLTGAGTWAAPGGGLDQATADGLYVNIVGDTMTGPLILPTADPTLPEHAAHKKYVDAQISAGGVPGTRAINTTAPLTGGGTLAADLTLAIAPFAGTGPGAVPISTNDATLFLSGAGTWLTPPGSFDQADADLLYVAKAGDTMTGPLVLPANATLALQAVPLQQLTAATAPVEDPAGSGLYYIGATPWA